ncbi:MAG: PDZ domain-containing protein, partial [Anaerolineales bacterium]|nr:PDZ domain-containing protein [Anaerolineales bacterium]
MSNRLLNIFAVIMVILMAGAAFAAGYLVRGLRDPQITNVGLLSADSGTREAFGLFWEAWGRIESNYIDDLPDPERVVYGAIRGALSELQDPYTVFVEPPAREQERETLRGNFGGIGVTISRLETGEVIMQPIDNNPAAIAGVLLDDILVAVDGVVITPEMSLADIGQMIRGEKGTEVRLTVQHQGEPDTIDIVVVRDDILIPSVSFRLLRENESIGYIQLIRFTGETVGEVEAAIATLREQGATQLVLDLRGNGGGLLDAAVGVADHFLVDGDILIQRSREAEEQIYEATEGAVAGDMPVVVLIDGGTASAAEIVAGALGDRERAT